jgi:dethiobiotin synthetase
MRHFKNLGKLVIGMKPVASGCESINGILVNDDALLLQESASVMLPYELVNPYAYMLPISPHLAGKDNPADFRKIIDIYTKLKDQAEIIFVEGAGGWYSPLNDNQKNSELAVLLGIPVILVVGIKLGCINHALLTAKAMATDNAISMGWIANCLDANSETSLEVIETLKAALEMPLIGMFPYLECPDFDYLAKEIEFEF